MLIKNFAETKECSIFDVHAAIKAGHINAEKLPDGKLWVVPDEKSEAWRKKERSETIDCPSKIEPDGSIQDCWVFRNDAMGRHCCRSLGAEMYGDDVRELEGVPAPSVVAQIFPRNFGAEAYDVLNFTTKEKEE